MTRTCRILAFLSLAGSMILSGGCESLAHPGAWERIKAVATLDRLDEQQKVMSDVPRLSADGSTRAQRLDEAFQAARPRQ